MTLIEHATSAFVDNFGYKPSHHFHAPGRVNLIGEHTDYNDGFVLPAAINFGSVVVAAKRADNIVRVCAVNFNNEVVEFSLDEDIKTSTVSTWSNYVRGVCVMLRQHNFTVNGMDLTIVGDVPYGAGLSSSAALEVVLIRTITELAGEKIDPTNAALIGQQTENEFIGAQTGIMDQLIIARAEKDHAVLIDCRDLSTQPIPLDPAFKIVIFNSNVKRGLVDSEYNTRRMQCQAAVEILGVKALRDATMDMLNAHQHAMDDMVYRRAKHVITENARTLHAATALKAKDWQTMGRLMAESHQSMSKDFEITVPAIDGLVDLIAEKIPQGAGGVRMTGGGFGGCVVSVVAEQYVNEVIEHVAKHYQTRFNIQETVYICHAVDGAFSA